MHVPSKLPPGVGKHKLHTEEPKEHRGKWTVGSRERRMRTRNQRPRRLDRATRGHCVLHLLPFGVLPPKAKGAEIVPIDATNYLWTHDNGSGKRTRAARKRQLRT